MGCNFVAHAKCCPDVVQTCIAADHNPVVGVRPHTLEHNWQRAPGLPGHPVFCAVCRGVITKEPAGCADCGSWCHAKCADQPAPACIAVATAAVGGEPRGGTEDDAQDVRSHAWVEGIAAPGSLCLHCAKPCADKTHLFGYGCRWCAAAVHPACTEHVAGSVCDLGELADLIVPPWNMSPGVIKSESAVPGALALLLAAAEFSRTAPAVNGDANATGLPIETAVGSDSASCGAVVEDDKVGHDGSDGTCAADTSAAEVSVLSASAADHDASLVSVGLDQSGLDATVQQSPSAHVLHAPDTGAGVEEGQRETPPPLTPAPAGTPESDIDGGPRAIAVVLQRVPTDVSEQELTGLLARAGGVKDTDLTPRHAEEGVAW